MSAKLSKTKSLGSLAINYLKFIGSHAFSRQNRTLLVTWFLVMIANDGVVYMHILRWTYMYKPILLVRLSRRCEKNLRIILWKPHRSFRALRGIVWDFRGGW
jgi:hypothetical protein